MVEVDSDKDTVKRAYRLWKLFFECVPEMKEKYQIMSVPCTIINDRTVVFGRKTVDDLLAVLEES